MNIVIYPQPREGIAGTLREDDDLLSLDDKAIPRRAMMIGLAMCLHRATLVGDPAPVVARMGQRIRSPEPGDLVVEASRIGRWQDVEAFGILLAHRDEWWHSDEEWRQMLANGEYDEGDSRPVDDTWYVQYGPQAIDVCRWTNCTFITIPTDANFGQVPFGTRDGNGVTLTRDDLLGSLADSGIKLRAAVSGEAEKP